MFYFAFRNIYEGVLSGYFAESYSQIFSFDQALVVNYPPPYFYETFQHSFIGTDITSQITTGDFSPVHNFNRLLVQQNLPSPFVSLYCLI